jgi:hypothetical protein
MTEIKVFKLISGEELIGKTEVTGLGYTIEAPATILMQQTKEGVGLALMPYMPYADGKVKLFSQCIATEGTPSTNMVNEYNRLFGSGIQVAPASALAGLQMP